MDHLITSQSINFSSQLIRRTIHSGRGLELAKESILKSKSKFLVPVARIRNVMTESDGDSHEPPRIGSLWLEHADYLYLNL